MTDPLITPRQLHDLLDEAIVLDATYYLPPDPVRSRDDHRTLRVPGARLFEIDEIADKSSDLPHMLPSEDTFAAAMAALGIDGTRPVVVYDRSANHFSAPRVWFTLRAFGVPDVRVLDGGLKAWIAAGLPTETGLAKDADAAPRRQWRLKDGSALTGPEMAEQAKRDPAAIVDARSADRFAGRAPEPRPGLQSGHMDGSLNVPFDTLTGPDGRFLDAEALSAVFGGLASPSPVVTCGSGMTACALALGLARIGTNARLYDGSWADWGRGELGPIASSPPAR